MIGYTCVGTNHLDRAVHFYNELLGLLEASPFFKTDRGVGWGVSPDQPMFSVLKPFDGHAATAGNGTMVALTASSPQQVQALHAKALALGGSDEGAPGPRGTGYYVAYFRDLDGNKLAAFCMQPSPVNQSCKNNTARQIIESVFTASNQGQLHFGEVIGQLTEVGVASYTVDYRTRKTTYYLQTDESLTLDMGPKVYDLAKAFSAAGIRSAIAQAQQGAVMYPEFKRLSMQAGCTGYTVWIAGRQVCYYGRKGETHVEHFPQ